MMIRHIKCLTDLRKTSANANGRVERFANVSRQAAFPLATGFSRWWRAKRYSGFSHRPWMAKVGYRFCHFHRLKPVAKEPALNTFLTQNVL